MEQADTTQKIKLLVINENTLAYQEPDKKNEINVLMALVTKKPGSRFFNYNHIYNFLLNKSDTIRLASSKDFEDYRISFEGYNSDEYEFEIDVPG